MRQPSRFADPCPLGWCGACVLALARASGPGVPGVAVAAGVGLPARSARARGGLRGRGRLRGSDRRRGGLGRRLDGVDGGEAGRGRLLLGRRGGRPSGSSPWAPWPPGGREVDSSSWASARAEHGGVEAGAEERRW